MDAIVLEALPGQRAVISTRGLLRVVLKNEQEILEELLLPTGAKAFVETYNDIVRDGKAVAVPYAESYPWQDGPLKRVV